MDHPCYCLFSLNQNEAALSLETHDTHSSWAIPILKSLPDNVLFYYYYPWTLETD